MAKAWQAQKAKEQNYRELNQEDGQVEMEPLQEKQKDQVDFDKLAEIKINVQSNVQTQAMQIQQEINAKQDEIDQKLEEIKFDNELFDMMRDQIKYYRVKSQGKDRLKTKVYNSLGRPVEKISFHDNIDGTKAQLSSITKAITTCAVKSSSFNKAVNQLKSLCTYSNLNLDHDAIEK